MKKIIVNGTHYHTESEDSNWKGFGGRKWVIEFLDGEKVVTTNLFMDGTVKNGEPDTARFLDDEGHPVGWVRVGEKGALYEWAFGRLS